MAKSTTENRVPSDEGMTRAARPAREPRETAEAVRAKPKRRRANDITSAIGLTPITGLSGPKIAY